MEMQRAAWRDGYREVATCRRRSKTPPLARAPGFTPLTCAPCRSVPRWSPARRVGGLRRLYASQRGCSGGDSASERCAREPCADASAEALCRTRCRLARSEANSARGVPRPAETLQRTPGTIQAPPQPGRVAAEQGQACGAPARTGCRRPMGASLASRLALVRHPTSSPRLPRAQPHLHRDSPSSAPAFADGCAGTRPICAGAWPHLRRGLATSALGLVQIHAGTGQHLRRDSPTFALGLAHICAGSDPHLRQD